MSLIESSGFAEWKAVQSEFNELNSRVKNGEFNYKQGASCEETYNKVYSSLVKRDGVFSDNQGTLKQEILAVKFIKRKEIQRLIQETNEANKNNDFVLAAKKAERAINAVKKLESNLFKMKGKMEILREEGVGARVSKRKALNKLPDDYQVTGFNRLHDESLKTCWALLCATGARPSELAKGIKIETVIVDEEEFLKLTIQNSKIKEGGGNDWRELTVKPESAIFDHLKGLAGQTVVTHQSGKSITDAINRQAERLELKGLSPYVFRHHFASSVKHEHGYADEFVSQALGHSDSKSCSRYGSARSTKGGRACTRLKTVKTALGYVNTRPSAARKSSCPKR